MGSTGNKSDIDHRLIHNGKAAAAAKKKKKRTENKKKNQIKNKMESNRINCEALRSFDCFILLTIAAISLAGKYVFPFLSLFLSLFLIL